MPCSSCVKKVVDCRYEMQDHDTTNDGPSSPHEMPEINDAEAITHSNIEVDHTSTPRPITNDRTSLDLDLPGLSGTMPRPPSAAVRADFDGSVDWFSMRIERDSPTHMNGERIVQVSRTNFTPIHKDLYPLPKAAVQKYLDFYYTRFHHRWTIIHSPSLEIKSHMSLILSSMKMIGAWLSGAQDAKWLAIAMHERLMSHILPQFVWPVMPNFVWTLLIYVIASGFIKRHS